MNLDKIHMHFRMSQAIDVHLSYFANSKMVFERTISFDKRICSNTKSFFNDHVQTMMSVQEGSFLSKLCENLVKKFDAKDINFIYMISNWQENVSSQIDRLIKEFCNKFHNMNIEDFVTYDVGVKEIQSILYL